MKEASTQTDTPANEAPPTHKLDAPPRFAHVDPEVEGRGNHDEILWEQARNMSV